MLSEVADQQGRCIEKQQCSSSSEKTTKTEQQQRLPSLVASLALGNTIA